jgi:hypothetical protein
MNGAADAVALSVVIPCLNEEESLPAVLARAKAGCQATGVACEIVVADNGSTDRSVAVATAAGAHVVPVRARGYGAALDAGIRAARGRWVLMGDADGSYDFASAPSFVAALRQGADVVQGCRLPAGGGTITPGAMPWLHRWIGNPLLTRLSRAWLHVPVHDVYCGLRAFDRQRVLALDLQCRGMEFAVEMLVRATQRDYRIDQVPVTLSPDLRRTTSRHLRTFRDGWRTLRFLLLYSPRWLFLIPGMVLVGGGLLAAAAGWIGLRVGSVQFEAHTLLVGCATAMLGTQAILFAYLTKLYGVATGLLPHDRRVTWTSGWLTLERGLLAGLCCFLAGGGLTLAAALDWLREGLGPRDYASTMRLVIPGVFLAMVGLQGFLFSWYASILGVRRP